jgi:hypothetical protein
MDSRAEAGAANAAHRRNNERVIKAFFMVLLLSFPYLKKCCESKKLRVSINIIAEQDAYLNAKKDKNY